MATAYIAMATLGPPVVNRLGKVFFINVELNILSVGVDEDL